MRDGLEEQNEAYNATQGSDDGEDNEGWAPYEEEQSKTKMTLCNVCSKECKKKCSKCKSVFCECDLVVCLVTTEHQCPCPDCGPEHQREVREEQARVVETTF